MWRKTQKGMTKTCSKHWYQVSKIDVSFKPYLINKMCKDNCWLMHSTVLLVILPWCSTITIVLAIHNHGDHVKNFSIFLELILSSANYLIVINVNKLKFQEQESTGFTEQNIIHYCNRAYGRQKGKPLANILSR